MNRAKQMKLIDSSTDCELGVYPCECDNCMERRIRKKRIDTRFPCWRIRVFQKFKDKWQPSYFGWHWVQDMVYYFDRSEEEVINEMMDKVERMLSNSKDYQALTIEARYCINKEELNQ